MTAATSFYFGIFKKIQACGGFSNSLGYPHCQDPSSEDDFGFNLRTPDGLFKPLDHDKIVGPGGFSPPLKPLVEQPDPNNPGGPPLIVTAYPLLPAGNPLAKVPEANPLYAMFKASLTASGAIVDSVWYQPSVSVQGSPGLWPVMPMHAPGAPTSPLIDSWVKFNKPGPHSLLETFRQWIVAGKPNDTPTAVLNFAQPPQSSTEHPVLFVCSKTADDGVRPGSGLDKFWATSRIFLVNAEEPGLGAIASVQTLLPGKQYNVVAQIGNSGTDAGTGFDKTNTAVTVQAEAYAFNTFMSSFSVPLPPLSNLDPADSNVKYEEYVLRQGSYALAGFRFDVDTVFHGLQNKLDQAVLNDPNLLNGVGAKEWLMNSHPCVKVRIAGDANNPLPAVTDSPATHRRIAQRNLKQFDHTNFAPSPHAPPWHHFIVEQPHALFDHAEGTSTLRLTLLSTLPPEAFKFLLAVGPRDFSRYFHGGKGLRGFVVLNEQEIGRELPAAYRRPFPDAVILRPTSASSALEFTVDTRHPLLAMSLGLVHDATRHPTHPIGSVSMVHDAIQGRERLRVPVGGFTIEIVKRIGDRQALARSG